MSKIFCSPRIPQLESSEGLTDKPTPKALTLIGAAFVWLLISPSLVRADDVSQDALCSLEDTQFNTELELLSEATNERQSQANALRLEEIKGKLRDFQAQRTNSRIAFFNGRITHLERAEPDPPHNKMTAAFAEGQKQFNSFHARVLSFNNNRFTDVFNLQLAIDCPQTAPTLVLSTFATDANLQANYIVINDHQPPAPKTDLRTMRTALSGINVGDHVVASGLIQLFMYSIPDTHWYPFLNRYEQLPPESPEMKKTPNAPQLQGDATSGFHVAPREADISIIYYGQVTDIKKQ
jgi:hypothetical protein